MRRPLLFLLPLLALSACKRGWTDTGEEDQQAVQSRSYDYDVGSLVLSATGDIGVMSTAEGVVAFDTWTGDGTSGTNPEDFADPSVEDWYGDQVLIVDRGVGAGVFLWEPGVPGYEMREDEESEARAFAARSFSDGVAWVGRKAENCRILRDGLEVATIADCGYVRDMAAVDSDGTLFLGYDDDIDTTELLRLDPDGTFTTIDAPMYRMAWDDTRQVLYTADDGGTQVRAVTPEGGPVFSLDFDDPVRDVAALERLGYLAVLTVGGGDGYVHVFDQYSGEKLVDFDVGSSADSLAASADSSTMAWIHTGRLVIATIDWDALLASQDTAG